MIKLPPEASIGKFGAEKNLVSITDQRRGHAGDTFSVNDAMAKLSEVTTSFDVNIN